MASYRMIMLSSALPGRDEEYQRWYDEVHIPDMLKVPGFVAAQRFRIARNVTGKTEFPYVAIYEIEADSPEAAVGAMGAAIASGQVRMSDTVDITSSQGFICEPIGERVTSD
jgi:hypothetical protein